MLIKYILYYIHILFLFVGNQYKFTAKKITATSNNMVHLPTPYSSQNMGDCIRDTFFEGI